MKFNMSKLKLGVIFGGMSTEHDVQFTLIKKENGINTQKEQRT